VADFGISNPGMIYIKITKRLIDRYMDHFRCLFLRVKDKLLGKTAYSGERDREGKTEGKQEGKTGKPDIQLR
jgi:hypothetical protein